MTEADIFAPIDLSECRWIGVCIADATGKPIARWRLGTEGDLLDRVRDMDGPTFTIHPGGDEVELP
jgi:hypothetical protein